MKFLGPCEVCGEKFLSYRSLAQHLRHRTDQKHSDLQKRYRKWKDSYSAALRCCRCGEVWFITEKRRKGEKICPPCRKLKMQLGERKYSKTSVAKKKDVRPDTTARTRWKGSPQRQIDAEQVACYAEENGIRETMSEFRLSYKRVKNFCMGIWGEEKYAQVMEATRRANVRKGAVTRRQFWANLTPQEKAKRLESWHRKPNTLEELFLSQVQTLDYGFDVQMNVWKAVQIGGEMQPREADLRFEFENKVFLVFCDGEAFHGPRRIFEDKEWKIQDDIATAEAFFNMGYNTVRYSETEIHSGAALAHFHKVLDYSRVFRLWHPSKEILNG